MKTLRDIVEQHPEWLDLPLVVYADGIEGYAYLDSYIRVYQSEDWEDQYCDKEDPANVSYPVLVFDVG